MYHNFSMHTLLLFQSLFSGHILRLRFRFIETAMFVAGCTYLKKRVTTRVTACVLFVCQRVTYFINNMRDFDL